MINDLFFLNFIFLKQTNMETLNSNFHNDSNKKLHATNESLDTDKENNDIHDNSFDSIDDKIFSLDKNTQIKIYICQICQKTFEKSKNLRRHGKLHLEENVKNNFFFFKKIL